MSALLVLQQQWVAFIAIFAPSFIYFLTTKGWNKKYDAYYRHLSAHSSIFFLQGKWRVVFGLVWGVFFLLTIPLSGYLFWMSNVNATENPSLYNAGMAFFVLSVALLLGWTRIFFAMRTPKTAFWYTVAADICVTGFICVCVGFGNQPAPLIMYIVLALWMIVATIWTGTAAYVVPPYPLDMDGDLSYSSAAAAAEAFLPPTNDGARRVVRVNRM